MDKRAVTYARVSGDDQRKEGRNLAGQLEMYREYCQEKEYRIVAELAEDDRGASGASWDLPQLNKALDMAKAGEFDVLVTRELDRFARGLAKQLVVEAEFKRHGVDVEYVLAEYDDTPEGTLSKHVRAVIAEYERLKIKERMIRGRRQVVKSGQVMLHGNPPFGYEIHKDNGKTSLVVCDKEAKIVKMVFDLYVGEGLSMLAVAERMEGIPTCADLRGSPKTRRWGEWSAGSVSNILRNQTYTGVWTYAGDPELTVEVPAIIDPETWERAKERCSHNQKFARKNTKYDYLMARRLTCGACGSALVCHSRKWGGKPYKYYGCNASRLYATDCNAKRFFRADKVDRAVWEWVHSILLQPEQMAERLRKKQSEQQEANRPLQDRLTIIYDLLADNRKSLERLLDLYLSGDFDKDILADRKTRLEATITALEKERADLANVLESSILTDDQIKTIEELEIEEMLGLAAADFIFERQQEWIERLNVQATLVIEGDKQVAHVRCYIGEEVLSISANGSRTR